jgi:hypothetical protein
MTDEAIVCDTPDKIRFFSLLSMRGRLKLEMKGIRFKPVRGQSTAMVVKKMFGLNPHARRATALAALEAEIDSMKKANSAWQN